MCCGAWSRPAGASDSGGELREEFGFGVAGDLLLEGCDLALEPPNGFRTLKIGILGCWASRRRVQWGHACTVGEEGVSHHARESGGGVADGRCAGGLRRGAGAALRQGDEPSSGASDELRHAPSTFRPIGDPLVA